MSRAAKKENLIARVAIPAVLFSDSVVVKLGKNKFRAKSPLRLSCQAATKSGSEGAVQARSGALEV
jgi:hypothetical protein